MSCGVGVAVPEAADPLVALGARRVSNPGELAAASDIVPTNVTGNADVIGLAGVILGRLGAERDPCRLLDHRAVRCPRSPPAMPSVACRFVDAPIPVPASAQAATLSIMSSGNRTRDAARYHIPLPFGKTISGLARPVPARSPSVQPTDHGRCDRASAEAARLARVAGSNFAEVRAAVLDGSADRVCWIFSAVRSRTPVRRRRRGRPAASRDFYHGHGQGHRPWDAPAGQRRGHAAT